MTAAIPDEFTRPNGKIYRPNRARLVARQYGAHGETDGHGVIVFGTLDPAVAQATADHSFATYCGETAIGIDPTAGWWRDGYLPGGDRGWVYDDVRGRPGVTFTCGEAE